MGNLKLLINVHPFLFAIYASAEIVRKWFRFFHRIESDASANWSSASASAKDIGADMQSFSLMRLLRLLCFYSINISSRKQHREFCRIVIKIAICSWDVSLVKRHFHSILSQWVQPETSIRGDVDDDEERNADQQHNLNSKEIFRFIWQRALSPFDSNRSSQSDWLNFNCNA